MKKIILLMIIIFANVATVYANAGDIGRKNRAANRLFNRGEYEEALRLYDEAIEIDPNDAKLRMNRGSALYRLGEFDEAERSYLDALSDLQDANKNTVADAHYNLGNVQFRLGENLEGMGNMSGARAKYSEALENYINTLKLRPNDRDAKWNLQLAHEKIDLLENQQDQPQSQDGEGEGEDNQEQQQSQGGGDDQNQDDNQDDGESEENDDENQNEQEQEREQPRTPEQEMREEEAARMIEQFADDDEDLNRPPRRQSKARQPEKNW